MRELREQAREERGHLRVPEVAQEALAESSARLERLRPGRLGLPPAADRRRQRLEAEPDQVRGARDPDREECGLRGREQRRDPDRRRERPHSLSARDAERREHARAATAEQRAPDRERRVGPGRHDHDRRDAEERSQLGHAGSLAVPYRRPQMRAGRTLTVVGCHAGGEIGNVIVGGVLPPPGATVFEQMESLRRDGDWLRRVLLREPRGSVACHANLVVPPTRDDCDAGFIIMEPTEYPAMSGIEHDLHGDRAARDRDGGDARAGDGRAPRGSGRRRRGARGLPRRQVRERRAHERALLRRAARRGARRRGSRPDQRRRGLRRHVVRDRGCERARLRAGARGGARPLARGRGDPRRGRASSSSARTPRTRRSPA